MSRNWLPLFVCLAVCLALAALGRDLLRPRPAPRAPQALRDAPASVPYPGSAPAALEDYWSLRSAQASPL